MSSDIEVYVVSGSKCVLDWLKSDQHLLDPVYDDDMVTIFPSASGLFTLTVTEQVEGGATSFYFAGEHPPWKSDTDAAYAISAKTGTRVLFDPGDPDLPPSVFKEVSGDGTRMMNLNDD